ncbi:MAG TPA: peptidylprolyl isomerase [Rudaea sp.]|jgi:peptidyl-prolyl cis-trans isomerase C|uniref:peptidylprolyl isomerase n=1 Tax=Rudaea sp. TaxID=2136325 RepID=UPI002F952F28
MMRKILGVALMAGALTSAFAADADVQIVSQGGTTVTLADINAFMQRIPADRRVGFLDNAERVNQMVTNVLRDKQLAKLATEQRLDQDLAVQAQIAFATREILSKEYMLNLDKSFKIPPMEQAAREQYLAHKRDYVSSGSVEVQHVLISPNGRLDIEVKALVDKVHSEAVANPGGFDQLVEKYSDDPSKSKNKGHIEDGTSDKLVPAFVAAVKNLKTEGEISPVVQTQFGYHVIKLVKNHPGRQLAFSEVKAQIEAKLKQDYIAEQRRIFLSKLDEDTATVNPDLVELLHKRYAPAGTLTPTEAARGKVQ